jgi:hypothetical protein
MKISKFNDMTVYQVRHHTANVIHIHYSRPWIAYKFVRFETTIFITNPYITIFLLIPLNNVFFSIITYGIECCEGGFCCMRHEDIAT